MDCGKQLRRVVLSRHKKCLQELLKLRKGRVVLSRYKKCLQELLKLRKGRVVLSRHWMLTRTAKAS